MSPSTKEEAKKFGSRFYFTGVPCKNGHVSSRFTSNNNCYDCMVEWRNQNKDHVKEYNKKYKKENRERILGDLRKWKEENRDHVLRYGKEYRLENFGKLRLLASNRRVAKIKSTPLWADEELIELIYQECPEGCEIDHAYPLISKEVCGLHVQDNLQYLPVHLNRYKSNKMPEDCPVGRY